MKRTLLFRVALCAMLMMAPAAANAQGKAFKKLLKMDGVEHVHIPKFLIKLAAKNGEGLHVGDNTVIGGDDDPFSRVPLIICGKFTEYGSDNDRSYSRRQYRRTASHHYTNHDDLCDHRGCIWVGVEAAVFTYSQANVGCR